MTAKYADLKHVRRSLVGGGQVVVLDTGAVVNAEEDAMLQALHSRSIGGIDAHLVRLAQKGAQDFMQTYYIGYGDKSIGDAGTATIFIEGVSMLAAKAIQDSMLYNGQESSTRYIDFSKQPFINPLESLESQMQLELLRAFHIEGLQSMKEILAKEYPWDPAGSETELVWRKAINARAFDVMRSFLPAGAMTNLAWHTELRHAVDHLLRLRNHELLEVRMVANKIHEALDEKYPNSFKQKRYDATEGYVRNWMRKNYYFNPAWGSRKDFGLDRDTMSHELLKDYRDILETRPVKAELPKFLAECGTMQFSFLLDFGSFRDLQRHRSLIQRMPLLTTRFCFGHWYMNQMPDKLRGKSLDFLDKYENFLKKLDLSPACLQYYIPMGYQVPCRVTGDLPALVWVVELRSGISVHPTLRKVAQQMGKVLLERLGNKGLKLYIDESLDRFNIKRGHQDIVEKVQA